MDSREQYAKWWGSSASSTTGVRPGARKRAGGAGGEQIRAAKPKGRRWWPRTSTTQAERPGVRVARMRPSPDRSANRIIGEARLPQGTWQVPAKDRATVQKPTSAVVWPARTLSTQATRGGARSQKNALRTTSQSIAESR